MLFDLPQAMRERMQALEAIDERDRRDGTPISKRLRQIPPQTGQLLALLAASAPQGAVLEIGTSAGYSTLWLTLACRQRGDKVTTFELLPNKIEIAKETFELTGAKAFVELVHGDARGHLSLYDEVAFCFIDAEKEMYAELYQLVLPNLVPGGLLLADNVTSHAETLGPLVETARQDERVDALVLPVGKGLLLCSKRAVEQPDEEPEEAGAEQAPKKEGEQPKEEQ